MTKKSKKVQEFEYITGRSGSRAVVVREFEPRGDEIRRAEVQIIERGLKSHHKDTDVVIWAQNRAGEWR